MQFGFGFAAILAFAADVYSRDTARETAVAFAHAAGNDVVVAMSRSAWGSGGHNPIDTALYNRVFRLGVREASRDALQPEWTPAV